MFKEIVYKITSSIPKGKVLTYGQVAKLAGLTSPRAVGSILHKNPNSEKIPCHRVVNYQGRVAQNFAFGGPKGQIGKLVEEQVVVQDNKVDLEKYLWVDNGVDTLQSQLR